MFLLVPAYPGSPGQKAVKRLCVCVCVCYSDIHLTDTTTADTLSSKLIFVPPYSGRSTFSPTPTDGGMNSPFCSKEIIQPTKLFPL